MNMIDAVSDYTFVSVVLSVPGYFPSKDFAEPDMQQWRVGKAI